jgi:N-acyl-D-aspartate/D-glutamate deacylase
MEMHDLVIRGADVVNGLGHEPIRADVAVRDGRIAAIARSARTVPRSSMPAASR